MTWSLYLRGGLAFALQVLLLQALLLRGGKRYALLTCYIVALFLSTVVNLSALVSASGRWSRAASQYYWTTEVVHGLILFVTIIGFIYVRTRQSGRQIWFGKWLIGGAVVGAIGSMTYHYTPKLNLWMTLVDRDISFLGTLLNLVLWTVLMRDKPRNTRFLMVSGGLGIQQAGQACGHGFRMLYELWNPFIGIGNFVILVTYYLSLFILLRAFRHEEAVDASAPAA